MENHSMEMLLASCIHDMKNAISMILNSVDQLSSDGAEDEKTLKNLTTLRYEASRLNNDLIHLLGVYRIKENGLPIVIDEHEVQETIHDQLLKNEQLFKKYDVEVTLNCDDWLEGYYDNELVGSIINNVLVNTVRYTHKKIQIDAENQGDYLTIRISDDGQGYPESMCSQSDNPKLGINFQSGSTGLGLYFAGRVAAMHRKGDTVGYISITNGGPLGGGVFCLHLP